MFQQQSVRFTFTAIFAVIYIIVLQILKVTLRVRNLKKEDRSRRQKRNEYGYELSHVAVKGYDDTGKAVPISGTKTELPVTAEEWKYDSDGKLVKVHATVDYLFSVLRIEDNFKQLMEHIETELQTFTQHDDDFFEPIPELGDYDNPDSPIMKTSEEFQKQKPREVVVRYIKKKKQN